MNGNDNENVNGNGNILKNPNLATEKIIERAIQRKTKEESPGEDKNNENKDNSELPELINAANACLNESPQPGSEKIENENPCSKSFVQFCKEPNLVYCIEELNPKYKRKMYDIAKQIQHSAKEISTSVLAVY